MRHTPLSASLPRLLGLLFLLIFTPALRAQAVVTWGSPTFISGDTDVAKTGTLVFAYNFTDDGASATVNGVTFTAESETSSALTFTTTAGNSFYANSSAFGSEGSFYTNLSSGYQTLLQSSVYWDITDAEAFTTPDKITFNNLTTGNTYYMQFWVNDSRGDYSDRVNLLSDGLGHSAQLRFDAGTGAQSLGQFVTGSFVATGTTQDIKLSAAAGNAIQINALTFSVTAVPEPSTYAVFAGLAALGFCLYRRRVSTATR